MKITKKIKVRQIFVLLVFIAIGVGFSGCFSSGNKNTAATTNINRSTPAPAASETPTPDPIEALYGEWETDNPDAKSMSGATTNFVRWKINPGVKDQNGIYTGKVTDPDNSNRDLANYKIGPKNNLNLEFLPPGSGSNSYDYELSGDANTLTLKTGGKPIVLKKGTGNTDILKDAETIADTSKGKWKLDDAFAQKMNLATTPAFVEFEKPNKYDEGYGGTMSFVDSGGLPIPTTGGTTTSLPISGGRYMISAKGRITISDMKGNKSGAYKILNDGKILQIDFANNSDPDLYLTR